MTALQNCVLATSFLAVVPAARAQTVDYTAAEQMFGEPVTVSVTGKPQRASEAPANMTIVTADDIRRSGATDIPTILRFVPGLDVRRYGQFDAAVGIRGYNTAFNPRVLVLVDGRQVYNDDYGYTIWSMIPVTMAEIRQIEIIKGPNAALYGFNAVSGVINIVTFDPLRDRKNSVEAVTGTQRQLRGEAVATLQSSDSAGVRFSAKGQQADEFDGPAFAGSVERPSVRTGAADLRTRLTDDVQLNLSASVGKFDANYYIDVGSYLANRVDTSSLRGLIHADTSLGLLEFDLYNNMLQEDASVPGLSNSWDQDITVLKVSDLVRLGPAHTVRLSGEYRHNAIRSDEHFGGEMTSDLGAASASWAWQIRPDLAWTNAGRIDAVQFQRNGSQRYASSVGYPFGNTEIIEPSYNSSILYAPTVVDAFRLSTGRALQLPSLFSYGYETSYMGQLDVTGSRSLEPSAVTNYEFGYDRKLEALSSTAKFSVFYQDTDQTVGSPFGSGFQISPLGRPYLAARNFDGSTAVGGEIALEGGLDEWRWGLAYSLALLDDRTAPAILATAPSVAYELQTPKHSVIGSVGYTWGPLEIDAMARWQSSYVDFASDIATGQLGRVPVPDFVTINARVGYKLTEEATLSLTAEQANAARLHVSAGRETERRVLAGLRVDF